MSERPAPRREVVVGEPLRRRPVRQLGVRSEIDEQTEVGGAYVRGLMRSQLRAGLCGFGVLALLVGTLPLVFAAVPDGLGPWLSGPALVWLVLGGATYPVLLCLGHWYVRRAERNEQDFVDLVEGQ
ncbi:hypothetical protein AQ490_05150 [Wenjunlia vitaminophila]|uniref:DUF485 domain-containing protein n=1 Tax=Wenjunlia vitaminophila TaxID=76728 RepID=A0A0T6LP72_WENVI|nr:hypothetical protein [Wenjunlia vitaminophila]KRV47764.1 hypothetical protein AQ490_05150 [Wenjunlia vitaminophila]